jgi:predicted transcriptional regulator
MKSIFDWFRNRFQKWYRPDAEMMIMLQALVKTEEHEISCDQVFAVLDEFAEAVKRGENVLLLMPLVRQHLNMCPDCREEYETLLRMLQPAFA